MRLAGKVAAVTGTASGMGRSIAKRFAEEGAKVVAVDLNVAGVEELIEELGAVEGEIVAQQVDVSDRGQVEGMINLAIEKFGKFDILVNNAGIMDNMRSVGVVTDEYWDKIMDVNLKGVLYACRYAVNYWLDKGLPGRIINIASIGGLQGCRAGAAYTASKFAVVGLTKNIGFMYAQKGICCNAICPGAVDTNVGTGIQEPDPFGIGRATVGVPANPRSGSPAEIAATALFLASDEASFVNGVALPVDGGWTAY